MIPLPVPTVRQDGPFQKPRPGFAAFWDGTSWRDRYYDRLMQSSPAELTPAQVAEQEYCAIEKQTADKLMSRAAHIADLGCGTGRVSAATAERESGKKFWGVDLSQGQLEVFQNRLSRSALKRVTLINSSISELSLTAGSIDLAMFCNHTFGAILGEDREKSLETITHLLRRDGTLLIVGFSNLTLASECYENWNMPLISIDHDTGLIELESHRSLWEPDTALYPQLEPFGFVQTCRRLFELGYLIAFKLVEKRSP
jgi:SAM-dependent methyltransferase